MKIKLRALLCRRILSGFSLLGLLALLMSSVASGAVRFPYSAGLFEVEPATLQVSLLRTGRAAQVLSGAGFGPVSQVSEQSAEGWTITEGELRFRVRIQVVADALQVSIQALQPASLRWPRLQGDIRAYAIPFGEGSYIPADDPKWLDWLVRRYTGEPLVGALSLPFISQLHQDFSVTWRVQSPFDTRFSFKQVNQVAVPQLVHAFNRLAPDAPYVVSIAVGPADPLYGAGLYRQWLKANGQFTTLTEKIRAMPLTARLGGAPHIYLWDAGPLKVTDIVNWSGFVKAFARDRGTQGHLAAKLWAGFDEPTRSLFDMSLSILHAKAAAIPAYNQLELVRAINHGLRQIVIVPAQTPLAGGHDPAAEVLWGKDVKTKLSDAFGDWLAPSERWGGGLSLDTVNALEKAGLKHAWLGAKDWLDAFWHPQAVAGAKAAGYLVAVYDNYADAHPLSEPQTWAAAQMGDALAGAGQRDADGKLLEGFNGIGVFANAAAAQDYARQRMKAVTDAAGLNSYFLDVDAAGTAPADYTPGRETSEADNARLISQRLDFPSHTLGLVTGSEGGVSTFAANIAYSHGIATQPFDWTDEDMKRNESSPYYVGTYWPPETPTLFFQTVPLKPQLAPFVRSYRYRLPLYQRVLHDSLVTTHHWAYPSLKFSNEQQNTALLQLLYMTPPMYHLNAAVLERDMPFIGAYNAVFAPLHERLFTQELVDFQVLASDRSLQRTVFKDGTRITVNFNAHNAGHEASTTYPPASATVQMPGTAPYVIDIAETFTNTRPLAH